MRDNEEVKRGDVVIVCYAGRYSLYGTRPSVIIQNDKGNRFSSSVIVVPITSQPKKFMPTHVWIENKPSGMNLPGTALCEHIMTVYKRDIWKKVGHVSQDELEKLDHALEISIDLNQEKESI